MSQRPPRVSRTSSRQAVLTYVLVGVAVLLAIAVVLLLTSEGLFSGQPTTDAERDYQVLLEGLKENPKDPAVLMSLAEAEYELGKETDALKHAKAAIDYADKQPAFRLRYATLLIRSGDVDEARAMVQAEIDLGTPGDAEPYFLMAQIEREAGNLEEAEANITKALDLVPTSADFLAVYGTILEKQGKTDDAISMYEEALRFVPDLQIAIDGLTRLGAELPESTETTAHGGGS